MGMEAPPTKAPNGNARGILLGLFGSNLFALFVGGIYEYLALRGVINMTAAWIVLLGTWLIGVIGIVLSELVWGGSMRQRIVTGVLSATVLAVILYSLSLFVDRMNVSAQTSEPRITIVQNQPSNVNGDCNVVGNGNTVNNNCKTDIPKPDLEIANGVTTKNDDGTYTETAIITVKSPFPVGQIYIEAHASGIISFEVGPNRGGATMTGPSGVQTEFAFVTLEQAFGQYTAIVRVKDETPVQLRYSFQ